MSIMRVGVGVHILDQEGRILLGKRKNSHGEDTWATPGGHQEFLESPEEAAIREVHEETGLIIKNPKIISVTNDMFKDLNKHYITIHIETRDYSGTLEVKEPHKCEMWEWFSLDKLPEPLFLPLELFFKDRKTFA